MALELTTRRFTVEEYYRMAEAGSLGEDDRVELLDGEIVQMSPIGGRHAGTVDRLGEALGQAVGTRALVRIQNPLRPSETSEPHPDVCLLRPRANYYTRSHPGPGDVLLVVEVADASLRYDRDVKVPAYARAGIPEVWLLKFSARPIYTYRDPVGDGYGTLAALGPNDELSVANLPGVQFLAGEVFP